MVRLGLKSFFATTPDIEVAGEASNGYEAIQVAQDLLPDVILMDLLMPGMDGVEATRQIKAKLPGIEVIVLTSYHEDENIFPAIRAGALSYLLKDIDPDELSDAIRLAARKEAVLNPQVASRLMQEVRGGRRADDYNPLNDLTDREMEVLQEIASGKSNAEIATALFISEKTVKTHITKILSKLHLSDRTQAAVLAWQSGVVKKGDWKR
ncbi:MAG TPA: response regulator transcription factor [Anaerolineaceae bacterium]|nr:response regulator transcription factor [Anaerolineaceae bacterium]